MKRIIILIVIVFLHLTVMAQDRNSYYNSGHAKNNSGDYRGAIQDYTMAISLDLRYAAAYNGRGVSKNSIGDYNGAIQDFTTAINLDPNFAYAYNGRGNAKNNTSDYNGAIQDYTAAINIDHGYATAYNGRGNAKCNLGFYKSAADDYTCAINLNQGYRDAYNGRGNARNNLKDYKGAISDYTVAISMAPKYIDAYYNRANSKNDLGDYKGAIEDYSIAITLNPKYTEAYNNRGIAKNSLEDYIGAIEDYTKAIGLDPRYTFAYNNRGLAKNNSGDYRGGIEDYTMAISLDPNHTSAYNGRGNSKNSLGDYRGAIEDYTKAISLDPRYTYAYANRAASKNNSGDYRGAIEDASATLRIDSKYAAAYQVRGLAKNNTGNYTAAIDDYGLSNRIRNSIYNMVSIAVIRDANSQEETIHYSDSLISLRLNERNAYDAFTAIFDLKTETSYWLKKSLEYVVKTQPRSADFRYYYCIGWAQYKNGLASEAIASLQKSKELALQQAVVLESFPLLLQINSLNQLILNKMTTDKTPPVIAILSPEVMRGMKLVEKEKVILVKGRVTDASGIFEVMVNGSDASLQADGLFTSKVLLAVGDNTIIIRATDTKGNTATQSFIVSREALVAAAEQSKQDSDSVFHHKAKQGKFYALIIGVQNYQDPDIAKLENPIRDATALYQTLTSYYTFDSTNVKLLKNPTRSSIFKELVRLSTTLKEEDNLLIFYAGHGYWNAKTQQGYWFPSDARKSNPSDWLSNNDIKDQLRGMACAHTLLISDACFSGGILRSAFSDAPASINTLYALPSRKAMTSGTLSEVPDNSIFIQYLLKRLNTNDKKYLSSHALYTSMYDAVVKNSTVTPQWGTIADTGDEGGDFIFIKR